ncbi:MAG: hypothetical protein JWN08_3821 [Frankiales bacterium]|nr:hypothetical protein [Frankiales bacterium]
MRIAPRAAAALLSAAVLVPVAPALAGQAAATTTVPTANVMAVAPTTADTVAGRAALAAWTARDARAKATMAHLSSRKAARAVAVYRASATQENRDAADWARRDAAAKATVAQLARVRAAKAARASAGDRASRSGARTTSTGVWDRLAQCESGGNWSINTGNGYYGGLQFSAGSWRAVGGSGLPHQATKAEQIRRGEILKARAGWGSWPACSRELGLR